MAKIIIFGAGDIARLAHFYFTRDTNHEVIAFTVDPEFAREEEFLGLPLVPYSELQDRYPPPEFQLFVALSYSRMNQDRADICARVKAAGYRLASYVSSRCTNLSEHPIGDNCFILEDNTIQPFVKIGNNVVLWSGNHIGHDVCIDDDCFITSHVVISGRTHIKEKCFIGVNATIRNNVVIGERSLIVAGATILHSTEPGSVYAGERAKKLKKTSDQIKL